MGYEADGVALYGDWAVDADAVGAWITDDTIDTCLFEPLRAAGMLERATHYWVSDPTPRPIKSMAKLVSEAARWRTETIALYAGDIDDPDWMFHVALDPDSMRTALGIGAGFVDGKTRDQVDALVRGWSAALGPRGCRLSVATLVPPGAEYPRPRPPRAGTTWSLGALDYYLGRIWHERDAEAAAVLAAIEKATLPRGATRVSKDDVIRISFAADLKDGAAVASARVASEAWLTPLVPTKVARGWNEHGDRVIVPPIRRTELPPFTYYDAEKQIAYKALILDPETREIDEEMWAEIAAIATSGKLHHGKQVTSIRLVFPIREDAVFMHDRAIADGFEMVTYPKGTVLWQVSPPADDTPH
jgi:hypothetical protein